MELTPVANEAHFIYAQLQARRIGSKFGRYQRQRSDHVYINIPLIRR